MSLEGRIEEIKEVDFNDTLETVYGDIMQTNMSIGKLTTIISGKKSVSNDDVDAYYDIINNVLNQSINLINAKIIVICKFGKNKYIEPEKENNYNKILLSFSKINGIFEEVNVLNDKTENKLKLVNDEINKTMQLLNKSVENLINVKQQVSSTIINDGTNDIGTYCNSLLQFNEKRFNEMINEVNENKNRYIMNSIRKLMKLTNTIIETIISLSIDYSNLTDKTYGWNETSSIIN